MSSDNVVLNLKSGDYFDESIRLSECNISDWSQVVPPVNNTTDQHTLKGWYRYFPADPCQMGIWVKATNKTNADVEGRLLILWADAGLGQKSWRVVKHPGSNGGSPTATTPVVFAGDTSLNLDSITRKIWTDVPGGSKSASGMATHPCLKVYILPKILNGIFNGQTVNDRYILLIDSDTDPDRRIAMILKTAVSPRKARKTRKKSVCCIAQPVTLWVTNYNFVSL